MIQVQLNRLSPAMLTNNASVQFINWSCRKKSIKNLKRQKLTTLDWNRRKCIFISLTKRRHQLPMQEQQKKISCVPTLHRINSNLQFYRVLSTGREKGHGNINVIHDTFTDIKYYTLYLLLLHEYIHLHPYFLKMALLLQSPHLFDIQVALGDRWHLLNEHIMEATRHTWQWIS